MRAIPRKLLIHSAVLHRKTAKDLWGKESLGQGIPLEFVRVDPFCFLTAEIAAHRIVLSA